MNRLTPLLLLLAASIAWGDISPPQLAPVERLAAAAQSYAKAHPADAEGQYALGRVHYLAFLRGARSIPVLRETGDGEMPAVASDWELSFELYEARKQRADELALADIGERGPRPSAEKASTFEEARGKRARQLEEQDWHPRGDLPAGEMIAHAAAALTAFREASRLDPKNGRYVLALALIDEQFARWAVGQKPGNLPAELRGLSLTAARDACLRAFRLTIAADLALPTLPPSGLPSLVSHEAGSAYVRLADHERARLKASEKAALAEVKSGLKKLKRLRVGTIPPL
jgi:hypothetical protein